MADVFISYDHDDLDTIERLIAELDAEAVAYWWDKNLKDGDNFSMTIEDKIEEVRHVLVAWSANARESVFVRGEALEALDRGKLIQVVIDGSRLPVPFNALQATFLHDWNGQKDDARWRKLLTTLRGQDVTDPSVTSAVAAPAQSLKKRNLMRAGVSRFQRVAFWALPILLFALIGVGGAFTFLDVPLPEGAPPKETLFLGLGLGVIGLFALTILMLMQTLISTLGPIDKR